MSKFGDMGKLAENLQSAQSYMSTLPEMPEIDRRSRAERREDLEKELAALDKDAITRLRDAILNLDNFDDDHMSQLWGCKGDIENSLIKLLRYIDEFEELNSTESRKVALKEQELKLEARHDWREKFRLFFFRVLASVLFICTLFAIGYIEKEYDWATLPLSKYVQSVPAAPLK